MTGPGRSTSRGVRDTGRRSGRAGTPAPARGMMVAAGRQREVPPSRRTLFGAPVPPRAR